MAAKPNPGTIERDLQSSRNEINKLTRNIADKEAHSENVLDTIFDEGFLRTNPRHLRESAAPLLRESERDLADLKVKLEREQARHGRLEGFKREYEEEVRRAEDQRAAEERVAEGARQAEEDRQTEEVRQAEEARQREAEHRALTPKPKRQQGLSKHPGTFLTIIKYKDQYFDVRCKHCNLKGMRTRHGTQVPFANIEELERHVKSTHDEAASLENLASWCRLRKLTKDEAAWVRKAKKFGVDVVMKVEGLPCDETE